MSSVINISDASFENDVMNSGKLVVVQFWADWCGPCKALSPVIDEVSDDYGDSVRFARLNVDEVQEVTAKYGVRSLPTLLLFKSGQVVGIKTGVPPKNVISAFIETHI